MTIRLSDIQSGKGGFIIVGESKWDLAGAAVAGGGDVNGDGFADLVIGAELRDRPGVQDAGAAHVVFGGPALADRIDLSKIAAGEGGFTILGRTKQDYAGMSVGGGGDIDGDGYADAIVGAHFADRPGTADTGAVFVIYGGATPAAVVDLRTLSAKGAGFEIRGEKPHDLAGWSAASAGDINGDGIGDVAIGAISNSQYAQWAGAAYVVFGEAGRTAPVDLRAVATGHDGFKILGESAWDTAGWGVAAAGDLNGDGIDDLAVGTATDKAYVVFGSTHPIPTIKLSDIAAGRGGFKILAESPNDRAGKTLAGVGDINGDGIDDLLIGAPYNNAGAQSAGAAYVVFGRTVPFGTVDLRTVAAGEGGFKITGAAISDSAGVNVAPAGDVNGDGFTDLLIGRTSWVSSYESHAGGVYVVLGHGGPYGAIDLDDVASGIGGFEIVAARGDDFVSGGVAAGDVNGDGLDDILIGASGWSEAGEKGVGAAYVVYGNPNWGVNDGLHTLIGSFGADRLAGGEDDDTLWGLAGDDRIDGGSGNDTLNGGSGNDRLTGSTGDDNLNGGNDRDSADFTKSAGAITVNLATGTATGDGSDRLSGIENVLGSRFADTIIGDRGDNRLTGGAGDDRLDGGAGRDTAVYADAPEPLTVDLARGIALGDGLDHLTGIENILGSRFGDTLIGDAGDNWIIGRLGDDLLNGGAGQDTASFAYAPGPVAADLALGIAVGEGTDILIGIDNLKGSAYGDTLRGNALGNDLIGGAGDDRLSGGAGPDWLMGGAGADTFVFDPRSEFDIINDFQPGLDVIDLRAYDFPDFRAVSSRIAYDPNGAFLHLGDGDHVLLAHLTPKQLEAGDFLVG